MTEPRLADHDLAALVEAWLDWDQAAELIGVTAAKVRALRALAERFAKLLQDGTL